MFCEALSAMGISRSAASDELVKSFIRVYGGWQGRNVSSLSSPEDVGVKLLADSYAFEYLVEGCGMRVADLGSGNGWPGMALAGEGFDVALVDARKGACEFMERVLEGVNVKCVVVCARAEEISREREWFETLDLCTSRGMCEPVLAAAIAAKFLRPGGVFVAWLGPEQQKRLPEYDRVLRNVGLGLVKVHEYELPLNRGRRVVAAFEKTWSCEKLRERGIAGLRRLLGGK